MKKIILLAAIVLTAVSAHAHEYRGGYGHQSGGDTYQEHNRRGSIHREREYRDERERRSGQVVYRTEYRQELPRVIIPLPPPLFLLPPFVFFR